MVTPAGGWGGRSRPEDQGWSMLPVQGWFTVPFQGWFTVPVQGWFTVPVQGWNTVPVQTGSELFQDQLINGLCLLFFFGSLS